MDPVTFAAAKIFATAELSFSVCAGAGNSGGVACGLGLVRGGGIEAAAGRPASFVCGGVLHPARTRPQSRMDWAKAKRRLDVTLPPA